MDCPKGLSSQDFGCDGLHRNLEGRLDFKVRRID